MTATEGLAQVSTLATHTALSAWNFASDFLIVIILFGILFLFAWYIGRATLLSIIVAFYAAYAVYTIFPYDSYLPTAPALTALVVHIALYAMLTLVFYIILRRVVVSDFLYIGIFGTIILSFLGAAFLLALAYHIFPVASVYHFTPAVDLLFAPKQYFFWWFAAKCCGIISYMTLDEELKARGLIEYFSADPEKILAEKRTVYIGTDPTADSLHVGHLSWILLMKRLGDAGHKLIFLVGGGTGMIGDPKEKGERPMLTEKIVAANTRALKVQLKNILGRTSFKMVDNADWLMKVSLIPFLRDVGKYFTVNDLIKRDIIKKRLDTPDESISYTEFTYSLLQALDYLTLHEKYGANLQLGGSDQWTNILSGVDLIHKRLGTQVYALGMPLVTDATGKKFGKSEGNAIWLDPKKTSPFQFYQFWINLPDAGIEKYLRVYTSLPLTEIDALMELHQKNPGERQAQETLARLVTETVHGPAATAQVAAATDALFGTTPFSELSREARQVALAEAPSVALGKKELGSGVSLAEALVTGGLASSKSDARRLIEGKGITLSGFPITDPAQDIHPGDLPGGYALVRKGKQGVLILTLK